MSTATTLPATSSTPRAIPAPIAAAAPPDEPPATFPPQDALLALWFGRGKRVDEDPAVAAYLRGRGLDPTAIADLDVARALPANAPCPPWAYLGKLPWSRSGHRFLALLFDARGFVRSVIGRSIDRSAERKSIAPRGHTRAGLIMACSVARRTLRYAKHPSEWPAVVDERAPFDAQGGLWPASAPLRLVVCEGELDFAAWATAQHDATEAPYGTLGIVQGAWSDTVAARIPDRSRVLLAHDLDEQGNKYAARVIESLRGRDVALERWKARSAA